MRLRMFSHQKLLVRMTRAWLGRAVVCLPDAFLHALPPIPLLSLTLHSVDQCNPRVAGGSPLARENMLSSEVLVPQQNTWPLPLRQDLLSQSITDAHGPASRLLNGNRWKLFSGFCNNQKVTPEHCSVAVLLRHLQTLLDKGLAVPGLKVHVAANSAPPAKWNKSFPTEII